MEEVIGWGGHGTIYLTADGSVRKEACDTVDCITSKREYDSQKNAAEVFNSLNENRAKILSPRNYVSEYRINEDGEKCCSYEMDRISPPEGDLLWQA